MPSRMQLLWYLWGVRVQLSRLQEEQQRLEPGHWCSVRPRTRRAMGIEHRPQLWP